MIHLQTQFSTFQTTPSVQSSSSGQNNPDIAITALFQSQKQTYSAEVIPPRNGAETQSIVNQIELLKGANVDFISVTKGAGGSLRGGTLPIAQLIRQRFTMASVAHFTCRDYTIEEVENSLMDHHYFGIRNILALRGDPPDGKPDHFKPAPNRHIYAHQLVTQIAALNRGEYLIREGYDKTAGAANHRPGEKTGFCIGVAAYPEHTPYEEGLDFFEQKVRAGAQFAITQMIFSAEPYKRFVADLIKRKAHIPILPGIRILTNATTAKRMQSKFGIPVPHTLIERLEKCSSIDDSKKVGLDYATQLCQDLLKSGAPGIHVFIMNDAASAGQLLHNIRS
jgi:methylenetetrahydrofolate reductase (NADPH)